MLPENGATEVIKSDDKFLRGKDQMRKTYSTVGGWSVAAGEWALDNGRAEAGGGGGGLGRLGFTEDVLCSDLKEKQSSWDK